MSINDLSAAKVQEMLREEAAPMDARKMLEMLQKMREVLHRKELEAPTDVS